MAEVTRRRAGEMLRAVFEVLYDKPDGLPARTVLAEVERILPPTDFEKENYPKRPEVRRYEKLIRFHSINVVKAGWLVKQKGQWTLTDEGRKAFDTFKDPEDFTREAVRLYREWAKAQPEEAESEGDETSAEVAATLEDAESAAWTQIREYLHAMPPYDLQNLIAGLIRAMGYHVAWVAPPGPDRGVDIIAYPDALGIGAPRVKVQVKRRVDKITADGLRSFMAVLGDEDVGIFVSLGGFTPDAQMEARTQERRKLTLLDLEKLFDLWVEHYSKIADDERRLLPIKPIHFLVPSE